MSERIKKSDIIENDIFANLIAEMLAGEKALKDFDTRLKSTAETIKNDLGTSTKMTIEQMEKLAVAEKKLTKLTDDKKNNLKNLSTIEKERLKLTKQVEKARLSELKLDRDREKSIDSYEAKLKKSNANKKKLAEKEIKRKEKARIDEIKLQRAREKSIDSYNNKLAKQEKDKARQAEKDAKNSERERVNNEKKINAYNILNTKTRDYKNESKKLGAELLQLEASGKKNTKEFNDLSKSYARVTQKAKLGDAQLKKLDNTVGDNQRSVGNYANATRKLSSALGALGIAFGLSEGIRGVFNINQELSKATNTARAFFNVSDEGAKSLAKEATILSKVFGQDVNGVLKTANSLAKEFGITGEEALGLINTGFEKGADVQGNFLESTNEYAAQLRVAGLNAKETIAILTQTEQSGAFNDKAVDSIKEAVLSLREMTPAARDAIENIGISADQVQADIASGSKTYFDVIQEISVRTSEFGDKSEEAGIILADVFKGAGEDAGKFVFELGNLNTSLDDIENQNKGLEKSTQDLTKAFYEYVYSVEDGVSFMDKLSGVIGFLAQNFNTILSTIGKLIIAFGTYRLALIAVNIQQNLAGKSLRSLVKGLFSLKKGADGGATSIKGVGKALKGIVWVAIIGAAIELATSFYDIASGAKEAKRRTQELDNYNAKSKKEATEFISNRNKVLESELNLIRRKMELDISAAKTEEQKNVINNKYLSDRLKLIESNSGAIKTQIKITETELTSFEKKLKRINDIENQRVNETDYKKQTALLLERGRLSKELGQQLGITSTAWFGLIESNAEFTEVQSRLNAEISGTKEELVIYNSELSQSNDNLKDAETVLKVDSNERENNTGKINAQIPVLKELNEELKKERDYREEAVQHMKDYREQSDLLTIDFDLPELERPELPEILNEFGETEEQEKARLAAQKQAQKELFDSVNNAQKSITDVLSDNIDKRIALLEKENEHYQNTFDFQKQLAAEGNINADQSMKQALALQIKNDKEIADLEKRKNQIKMISQGLETYGNLVAGGESPGSAFAQTVVTTTALLEFLTGLGGFEKGTDSAPEGWAWTQEKGSEIITDSKGKIKSMGSDGGHALTYLNKGDQVKTAKETTDIIRNFGQQDNSNSVSKTDQVGNSYDLLSLSELKGIKQAIQNQPHNTTDWENITNGVGAIRQTNRRGGDKFVSKHLIRR